MCKIDLNSIHAAFITYVCFFADPETSDVGRFCIVTLPSRVSRWLERTLGRERHERLTKLMDHGFQLIYLVVVLGCWSIVFAYGYPEIERSAHVPSYHRRIGYAVFVACMTSWHCACTVRPGNVTATTMTLFDHYEYDNVLYTDRTCPTLKIREFVSSSISYRNIGRQFPSQSSIFPQMKISR